MDKTPPTVKIKSDLIFVKVKSTQEPANVPIVNLAETKDLCRSSWLYSFDNQSFKQSDLVPFDCSVAVRPQPVSLWIKAGDKAGNISEAVLIKVYVQTDNDLCAGFIDPRSEGAGEKTFVYPNPAQDALYIESAQTLDNIVITDLRGRSIYRYSFSTSTQPPAVHRVDLSAWPAGQVVVKTQTRDGQTRRALVYIARL